MTEPMKFCKDCKHCRQLGETVKCEAPDADYQRDPINGAWPYAGNMRSSVLYCGRTAKWFEQKKEK